jgi:hypothetical protein
MTDEHTHECEKCHHVYSDNYGRDVETAGGAQWRCHNCLNRGVARQKGTRLMARTLSSHLEAIGVLAPADEVDVVAVGEAPELYRLALVKKRRKPTGKGEEVPVIRYVSDPSTLANVTYAIAAMTELVAPTLNNNLTQKERQK